MGYYSGGTLGSERPFDGRTKGVEGGICIAECFAGARLEWIQMK